MKNNRSLVSLALAFLMLEPILGFPLKSFAEDTTVGNGAALGVSSVLEQRLHAIEEKLRSLEDRLNPVSSGPVSKVDPNASTQAALASPLINPLLQERFEALDQKLRIIERRREIEEENIAAKTKENPIVTANGKDGFGSSRLTLIFN